ncbi:MAG: nicotinate-nucleotide adenylyltransferase [Deltaproteobacteria bacterium]|nr:nicotinate-nucleotide adenylyltransferase [Deltaproteobacteria bacterium]MBW2116505.1 nicotinate-nucleotide adenylyltransferase [Deltaproteobacteria bacterium]MBW2343175.1 nicotinate-nucleotide adenylyltransferase [Deltaproteobacteria bacterium]
MRLGILGGTFDPIHLGHLRTAEEIGQELDLEKVYLIPSASPPHKTEDPVTLFDHRLTMTRLAIVGSSLLDALDLEGRRAGPSYSIETLKELHSIFKPDPDLFFILGIDAFLEINTWKGYERLFDYAHFVIISRPGYRKEKIEPFLMKSGLDIKTLTLKETTLMDISSTRIREMVQKGKSIRFLVPGAVRDYITEKGLYGKRGNPR